MRAFLAKSQVAANCESAWWARQDSNLQPDRYERPALTIELQARGKVPGGECVARLHKNLDYMIVSDAFSL